MSTYTTKTIPEIKSLALERSRKKNGLRLSYKSEKPFSSILTPHFTLNETFTGFSTGFTPEKGPVHIYAHHKTIIAVVQIHPDYILITLNNGGYESPTTKNRLNTILSLYEFQNKHIHQHQHEWYINSTPYKNGTTLTRQRTSQDQQTLYA